MVLVVKHVTVNLLDGAAPDTVEFFDLSVATSAGGHSLVAEFFGVTDGKGVLSHEFDFANGVVVPSGGFVCLLVDANITAVSSAMLYGYFANDE